MAMSTPIDCRMALIIQQDLSFEPLISIEREVEVEVDVEHLISFTKLFETLGTTRGTSTAYPLAINSAG